MRERGVMFGTFHSPQLEFRWSTLSFTFSYLILAKWSRRNLVESRQVGLQYFTSCSRDLFRGHGIYLNYVTDITPVGNDEAANDLVLEIETGRNEKKHRAAQKLFVASVRKLVLPRFLTDTDLERAVNNSDLGDRKSFYIHVEVKSSEGTYCVPKALYVFVQSIRRQRAGLLKIGTETSFA